MHNYDQGNHILSIEGMDVGMNSTLHKNVLGEIMSNNLI